VGKEQWGEGVEWGEEVSHTSSHKGLVP